MIVMLLSLRFILLFLCVHLQKDSRPSDLLLLSPCSASGSSSVSSFHLLKSRRGNGSTVICRSEENCREGKQYSGQRCSHFLMTDWRTQGKASRWIQVRRKLGPTGATVNEGRKDRMHMKEAGTQPKKNLQSQRKPSIKSLRRR